MNVIDGRTTDQPESGLTRPQFHLALSGIVLCLAAAAFAVFVQAAIGLIIIEVCAFCIGFYCSSLKKLETINRRMDQFTVHLAFLTLMQTFFMTVVVHIAIGSNSNLAEIYKTVVFSTSLITFLSAWTLGLVLRAPWQRFRA